METGMDRNVLKIDAEMVGNRLNYDGNKWNWWNRNRMEMLLKWLKMDGNAVEIYRHLRKCYENEWTLMEIDENKVKMNGNR